MLIVTFGVLLSSFFKWEIRSGDGRELVQGHTGQSWNFSLAAVPSSVRAGRTLHSFQGLVFANTGETPLTSPLESCTFEQLSTYRSSLVQGSFSIVRPFMSEGLPLTHLLPKSQFCSKQGTY